MIVYADSAALKTWMDATEAPANAATLLRAASILVRHATRAALYDTDDEGKPSDSTVLQAFSDATCSQAAMWAAAKIDPAAQGAATPDPVIASKAMGGRSVTYATTYADAAASITTSRANAARELCAESRIILANAGLLDGQPGIGYTVRRSILDA